MVRTAANPTTSVVPRSSTARSSTAGRPGRPKKVRTSTSPSTISVGTTFASWKEAFAVVRAIASTVDRRIFTERPVQLTVDDSRVATVRRAVCQNHRHSQCDFSVVFEERSDGAEHVVLSLHLTHSDACRLTINFGNQGRTPAGTSATSNSNAPANALMNASLAAPSRSVGLSPSALLHGSDDDDSSAYQLTHEMRWSTGKEVTKAVSDFALVVQRKRAMLCKRNNGGMNKKYVCSDEQCLWFVQLVKGSKQQTSWKISAMNLRHCDSCTGGPKPTTRQLAEMPFFRHAVVTHTKKTDGTLLTDDFLLHSASGIAIPRGMAYRAKRLVVATTTDDVTESYKFLPSLLDAVTMKNPGSIVSLERDTPNSNHFLRLFVLPSASTFALESMQPVLGIEVLRYDNVNFTGCVALLIGRDGNLTSHVLAFAVLPTSDVDQMKWFLGLCRTGGVRFDAGATVFCSHRESGVIQALAADGRGTNVMYCVQSLIHSMRNDKSIPALGTLEELVFDMQRAETEDAFKRLLTHLEELNAPAAAFLRSVAPQHWASYANRATSLLFEWTTTNVDDALAGSEIQASDEPPFDLVYSLLGFLMDGVAKKSQLAATLSAANQLLTPNVDALYRRELRDAAAFTVRACDAHVAFAWRTGDRPKVMQRVDLAMRACTCGRMQQHGVPCHHFVAVAQHFGNEAALLDGFDAIYKAATFVHVHQNLRIEIPTSGDLTKDASLLPAASQRGVVAKEKAQARAAKASAKKRSRASVDTNSVDNNSADNGLLLPHGNKTPRLDFGLTGLTDLIEGQFVKE